MYKCTGSIIDNKIYRVKETLVRRSTMLYLLSIISISISMLSYKFMGETTVFGILLVSAFILCAIGTSISQLEKTIRTSSEVHYTAMIDTSSVVIQAVLSENGVESKSIVLSVLYDYRYDKQKDTLTITSPMAAVQNMSDNSFLKCTIHLCINNAGQLVDKLIDSKYVITMR